MSKKDELKQLEETFENKQIAVFLMTWLENGLNATKAYMKLHPNVDYHSARTLGSRLLTKVDIYTLLASQNLGIETYIQKLKEGLEATMLVGDERLPDHQTRRLYHRIQGILLGLE